MEERGKGPPDPTGSKGRPDMPHTIDLGAGPSHERHAEPGRTIGFADLNAFEVRLYRIALIAYHGRPPRGCTFLIREHLGADGVRLTLALRVADDADIAALGYADAVSRGIATWAEVGMAPPVDYSRTMPTIPVRDEVELILLALLATKPDTQTQRRSQLAQVYANLSAAFPDLATVARETGDNPE